MNNPLKKIAAAVLFILSSIILQAQSNIAKYEFGAGISSFVYQGDLTPNRLGSYETLRGGINLYAAKILGPSFSVRANLAIGSLGADDAKYEEPEWRQERNFNFRTPVVELAPMLVWSPLGRNYEDKGLSPYLMAGAGLTYLSIRRDWSNFNTIYFGDASGLPALLAQDIDHGLPRIIPVIPLGIGVRYALTPQLAVSLESTYRLSYTDYLDGFSKAANPELKDHYQTITAGIIYRSGKKNKLNCPAVTF